MSVAGLRADQGIRGGAGAPQSGQGGLLADDLAAEHRSCGHDHQSEGEGTCKG